MGKTKKIKSPEELNYQLYFGEQLKRLLKKVGVTQLEFAQELNISKNTVCQWIHGLAAPEPLLFRKVVQFFLNCQIPDFNIYDLFMIDEPAIPPHTISQMIDELREKNIAVEEQLNLIKKRKAKLEKKQDQIAEEWKWFDYRKFCLEQDIETLEEKKIKVRNMAGRYIGGSGYVELISNILYNSKEIQELLALKTNQEDEEAGYNKLVYRKIKEEVSKEVLRHVESWLNTKL